MQSRTRSVVGICATVLVGLLGVSAVSSAKTYRTTNEAQTPPGLAAQQSRAGTLFAQARETCTFIGETIQEQVKTCKYSCPSGETVITVRATSTCPTNIQR